jgi:hypothetical protein
MFSKMPVSVRPPPAVEGESNSAFATRRNSPTSFRPHTAQWWFKVKALVFYIVSKFEYDINSDTFRLSDADIKSHSWQAGANASEQKHPIAVRGYP